MNKQWSWEDLLVESKQHKKIIISGCQRTGTTLCSRALAEELNYTLYDEVTFDFWDQKKFSEIFNREEKSVIQAPSLLHILPYFENKALIVIMTRDINQVINSMNRVDWFRRYGKEEFRKFSSSELEKPEQIYHTKLKFADTLKSIRLDFTELKKCKLFIENRPNWDIKQTSVYE